jgi:hypothetical protein
LVPALERGEMTPFETLHILSSIVQNIYTGIPAEYWRDLNGC